MATDYKFRFIPRLPTKAAWDNRAFNEYRGESDFYGAILKKEKTLRKFFYISGFIHFKAGFYSTYKDGTEPRTYNNSRWWKTGAKSCIKGCCTVPPPGETFDSSEPAQFVPKPYNKSWQEFKRIDGVGGLIDQLKQIPDKTQISSIQLTDLGSFYVEY
jgi:hypothetical protein